MPKTESVLDSTKCPGCGETIPISETIYHQVAERGGRIGPRVLERLELGTGFSDTAEDAKQIERAPG